MALHKYFKPSASNTSHALNAVPVATTIAQLTTHEQIEVENAIRNLGEGRSGNKKKPYTKYDERKRCEVAKFAQKCSIKAAARKYDIPVTTVRGFVKSFNERKAGANPIEDIVSLPLKKTWTINFIARGYRL